MPLLDQSRRGTCSNPQHGSQAYPDGLTQAKIADERCHILFAIVQKKFKIQPFRAENFEFTLMTPDFSVDFSTYEDADLRTLYGTQFFEPLPSLGKAASYAIQESVEAIQDDWQYEQCGILAAIKKTTALTYFFTAACEYHLTGRTGFKEWDTMFSKLRTSGYSKSIVPCLWFGQLEGCLIPDCPYLHDLKRITEARASILSRRRSKLKAYKHTPSPNINLERLASWESLRMEGETREMFEMRIEDEQAHCANPKCNHPWSKTDKVCPLKACSVCTVSLYCSRSCQKTDWPEHKEICVSKEDLIMNDSKWTSQGDLISTDYGLFECDEGELGCLNPLML